MRIQLNKAFLVDHLRLTSDSFGAIYIVGKLENIL